jgi:hypothetical protein
MFLSPRASVSRSPVFHRIRIVPLSPYLVVGSIERAFIAPVLVALEVHAGPGPAPKRPQPVFVGHVTSLIAFAADESESARSKTLPSAFWHNYCDVASIDPPTSAHDGRLWTDHAEPFRNRISEEWPNHKSKARACLFVS